MILKVLHYGERLTKILSFEVIQYKVRVFEYSDSKNLPNIRQIYQMSHALIFSKKLPKISKTLTVFGNLQKNQYILTKFQYRLMGIVQNTTNQYHLANLWMIQQKIANFIQFLVNIYHLSTKKHKVFTNWIQNSKHIFLTLKSDLFQLDIVNYCNYLVN